MTGNPVERYTRLPADVEALHLESLRDLHVAELWMRGHGAETAHRHPALTGRALLVPTGPAGMFTVAQLGQWLVLDQATGEFTVVPDNRFRATHRPQFATVTPALRQATR